MPLTLSQARAIIAAAEGKASAIGVPVIAAVVDAGVHLKAFTRMDGAVLASIDIALKKARTAASFQSNSEAVWEYCKPGAPAPGLDAVAEAMQQELKPFGIKVQTINPGAYLTGYNETMADTPFRWLDDSRNFTKRAAMRATFDSLLGTPEGRPDPAEMIARMVELVPADKGKFRNVVPPFVEDMLKKHQLEAWENQSSDAGHKGEMLCVT
jgi:uncharacterized protein GlcG (DUF336 family)